MLFIVKEEDANKKGTFYANVKGVLPLGTEAALAIPATFIRSKDRKDTRTAAPAQAPAAPVSNISANLTGVATAGTPVAPVATPAPAAVAAPAEVVLDAKF